MKKFVFITGAISIALISLGLLFKIEHWSGAGIGLTLGIGIFSILFIPSLFKYLYDREK